jgi:hypothetical protein
MQLKLNKTVAVAVAVAVAVLLLYSGEVCVCGGGERSDRDSVSAGSYETVKTCHVMCENEQH